MKSLRYIFLVPFLMASIFGCAPRFEAEFDTLRMDYTEFTVSSDAEKVLVAIYYSGSWTASLSGGDSWATLDKTSGSGVTYNKVFLKKNTGPSRKTVITIKADNGDEMSVDLTQKQFSGAFLTFDRKEMELPADALTIETSFATNMSDDVVMPMFEGFISEEWKSEVTYTVSEAESLEDGSVRRVVTLSLAENTSGESREIVLPLQTVAADDSKFGDEIHIFQGADKAYLTMQDKMIVNKSESECSIALEHNLGALAEGLKLSVTYPGEAKDFLTGLVLKDGEVSFSVSEAEADRTADIAVTFEEYGLSLTAKTEFNQVYNLLPRQISAAELVALFSDSPQQYSPQDLYTDHVVMYVVGGAGNPNMDQNINIGPNEITTDENDRTVYMQDALENPTQGFRVKFADKADNTLSHGDCVKLHLEGCTLIKETSPERYTIDGLTGSNIVKESEGHTVVPSVRSISSLSPADVYTYCKLENMEFQVKEGAYTNVREYNAIQNAYNEGLPLNYTNPAASVSSYSQYAMDGAVSLMHDNSGKAIYALINMGCEWRREMDKTVPKGVGSVNGVIVHQEMPRWGGNVGTYSIRPLDKSSFEISETESSNYNVLAAWKVSSLNLNDYKWNDDGSYMKGTSSDTQLVQNKLHATQGQTSAVLYSENRMLQHNKATQRDYPIDLEYGYRGTDASDYTSYTSFGYSPTAIAFYANPSGWFKWDGNSTVSPTDAANNNGIVMEFSTESASGSVISVGFSIATGYLDRDSKDIYANVAWQSSTSFPVYWKVQYATSSDGENWSEYKDAVNEATGVSGFEMRSVPWTMNGDGSHAVHYAGSKIKLYTQHDTGFGLVPYRYSLSSDAFGKARVKVRIVPVSDVIMTYNSADNWNKGLTYAGQHSLADSKQTVNVNNSTVLEDVIIQYK